MVTGAELADSSSEMTPVITLRPLYDQKKALGVLSIDQHRLALKCCDTHDPWYALLFLTPLPRFWQTDRRPQTGGFAKKKQFEIRVDICRPTRFDANGPTGAQPWLRG